ncbi:recE [Curtobacterium sp. MCSS17_006]|uniref:PD-(D/E)XK nuclease-like domain-containing protein n=1 Tax=Curtobacterium sp. MCSS17_006 TaxID=2175642 RepID=UPI000DA71262|nr:PD-(D/E)XK nuclease-like domain-containing protein [Curtobacterium sp. MCSS17_006]PZE33985.1 recE [Curtobacterium sp. MCSS17_006]
MVNGIVLDLDEAEYHSRPELSSTQARKLLDSPARYKWDRDHPQAPKKEFDLGTAVHSKVLGTGAPTVAIPDDLLASNGAASTKAAKEWIEEQRAAGNTPVKSDVHQTVHDMSEAVLAHPTARLLFEQPGNSEASVFATDPETGVELRARFDFLPLLDSRNPIAVDLKTTGKSASPEGFAKTVANFGYETQEGHYDDTLYLATEAQLPFVFVVAETTAPYLVGVHQLDVVWREMGHAKARRARELYAQCAAADTWPGYPEAVGLISPPQWAIYQHEEQYA